MEKLPPECLIGPRQSGYAGREFHGDDHCLWLCPVEYDGKQVVYCFGTVFAFSSRSTIPPSLNDEE